MHYIAAISARGSTQTRVCHERDCFVAEGAPRNDNARVTNDARKNFKAQNN